VDDDCAISKIKCLDRSQCKGDRALYYSYISGISFRNQKLCSSMYVAEMGKKGALRGYIRKIIKQKMIWLQLILLAITSFQGLRFDSLWCQFRWINLTS
jgi:hypothetical protein